MAELVADLGPAASAGSKLEAAECDVVILATNWRIAEGAQGNRLARPHTRRQDERPHGEKPDTSAAGVARSVAALEGRTSSETVAAMTPGARLVKSISNMPMAWIQDFSPQKPKTVLFVSGDDRDAKAVVVELIDSTGLVALDLGSLADGGAMQQLGGPLSLLNCTSSAGSFGKKNLSPRACESANWSPFQRDPG